MKQRVDRLQIRDEFKNSLFVLLSAKSTVYIFNAFTDQEALSKISEENIMILK